jgi:hypothetical protein
VFFVSGPSINHPASIEIQGNTIIDRAIRQRSASVTGPGPSRQPFEAARRSSGGGVVESLVPTATVGNIHRDEPLRRERRHVSVDDRMVLETRSRTEPVLPATFEPPPGNLRCPWCGPRRFRRS